MQIVINTLKSQFHKCEIASFDPVKLNNDSLYTKLGIANS